MNKLTLAAILSLPLLTQMGDAHAARYTPAGLCAITNNTGYESLTLPISIGGEYPSASTQSITIVVGDTEQPGGTQAGTGDDEYVVILIDTDNDGTPESFASDFCDYDQGATPAGCSVTQNVTIPSVTEDTTFRGRVMLSYGAPTPANGCGANSYGDNEDFLIVADVQETITIADVSQNEDGGPITVSAVLSHDVRDGGGFVSFSVDYQFTDGTATIADNDYVAASGTLTFNGQAGDIQTFTLTPVADIIPEGAETLNVSLSNLTNTTHGIDISDTATITLAEDDTEVELTIEKTADDIEPNVGQVVTFELTVLNAGPDAAVDAVVQDIVPAGLTAITPVIVPAGTSFIVTGGNIDWTGIDIPANGSVSATYTATVLPP